MYINQEMHRGREQSVLAVQLIGWLYESHCWVESASPGSLTVNEDTLHIPAGQRVCLWCKAVSIEDMKVEGAEEQCLCPKNPFVVKREEEGG